MLGLRKLYRPIDYADSSQELFQDGCHLQNVPFRGRKAPRIPDLAQATVMSYQDVRLVRDLVLWFDAI